jgi:dTDP-4-dehydrorhamnose 3,5-epimerase-like enzyme
MINQLFYLKLSPSITDKIFNEYIKHLDNQGIVYYKISESYMISAFDQFIKEKYNATQNNNNLIFTSQKDYNWFLLQL